MLIETEPERMVLTAEDEHEVACLAALEDGRLAARVVYVHRGGENTYNGRRLALEVVKQPQNLFLPAGVLRDASGRFAKRERAS